MILTDKLSLFGGYYVLLDQWSFVE
jgi:hypothetical protein